MKKLIKLILALLVLFLLVRLCTNQFGSVINLPGGLGKESTEDTGGGWFGQKEKEKTEEKTLDQTASSDEIKELEKELGIGTDKDRTKSINKSSTNSTSTSKTSTTASAASSLSFKGIPMTGSLSSFGSELVKAGFLRAGDGTYTGDFAGYSGCKVTPSGSNPVQEVRVDFPVISDWDALEKAYDSLQASLTQKYGKEPKTSSNSNVAVYDVPGGTITLDADVNNRSTWHVILTYANALTSSTTGTLGRNPIDDL